MDTVINAKRGRQKYDLFPTPFNIFQLGESSRELNKKLYNAVIRERKIHGDNDLLRSGINVWQSRFGIEKDYGVFDEFKAIISELTTPVLENMGFGGDVKSYVKLDDFWANVDETPYGYNTPHFHGCGNTVLSGVYYPTSGIHNGVLLSEKQDLDEPATIEASSRPKPGSIVFMDPAHNVKAQVFPFRHDFKRYPYYGLEICIEPKEGTLILFPQYVTHYVAPTEKENFLRMSIAFNVNLIR